MIVTPGRVSETPPGRRSLDRARALADGLRLARSAEDCSLSTPSTLRRQRGGPSETFKSQPSAACELRPEPRVLGRLWEMGEAFGPLLQEAREKIKHVEPWQRGTQRTPSTAFCILVRLFQLGLTEAHMTKLLAQKDPSPRQSGWFFYLRYVLKPELLWRYCEDVLIDDGRAILEEGRKETLHARRYGRPHVAAVPQHAIAEYPPRLIGTYGARVALVDESRERPRTTRAI